MKIKYSESAIKDLEEIGDYIAETLKSPMVALKNVRKIQDTVDQLADFPLIGALLSSKVDIKTDYRFLVCGNYLVFYHTGADSVFIDRVIYGKRDYIKILFDDCFEIQNSSE